jgi:hypothetical protein
LVSDAAAFEVTDCLLRFFDGPADSSFVSDAGVGATAETFDELAMG